MVRYYITTLGCPKNEADSREMEKSLLLEGFEKSDKIDKADFHIINTCAFIEEAKKETIETIFNAIEIKELLNNKQKKQKIIVVGCFAERYHKEVEIEIPEVDFIFGTGLYHRAGELIRNKFKIPLKQKVDYYKILESIKSYKKFYAPVKISDGCDRNCSFCAIPQFRGKFRFREKAEILKEVYELSQMGIKEICLVSQDTNSYGKHYSDLISLIEEIEKMKEIEWIRLLYLYPDKKTQKILQEIYKNKYKKVVPYLESPVQHVSEKILKKMNRFGNYEYFKDLFLMARELFPDLEIRTSFLIGFPEETYKDIELVKKFIEELKIEHISFFAFSPEENTLAYQYSSNIDKKEIYQKVNELQNYYDQILKTIMVKNYNKIYKCILENIKPKELHFRRPQAAPEIDDIVIVPFDYKKWKESNFTIPKLGEFYEIKIMDSISYDYIGSIKSPVSLEYKK
jgi:ribosomal protein S12 methylthiotransferase